MSILHEALLPWQGAKRESFFPFFGRNEFFFSPELSTLGRAPKNQNPISFSRERGEKICRNALVRAFFPPERNGRNNLVYYSQPLRGLSILMNGPERGHSFFIITFPPPLFRRNGSNEFQPPSPSSHDLCATMGGGLFVIVNTLLSDGWIGECTRRGTRANVNNNGIFPSRKQLNGIGTFRKLEEN